MKAQVKVTIYLTVDADPNNSLDAAEKAMAIVRSGTFPTPIVEVDPEEEEPQHAN